MVSLPPTTPSGVERDPPPRNSRNPRWPCEQIERLKALWDEGRLSASQMAHRLGISRSAVLGKVHRMGLATHKVKQQAKPPKPAPKAKKQLPPAMPTLELPPPPEPPFVGIVFDELTPNSCRYPQGDGPFVFCGQPKQDGSSYCAHHHRICYVPLSRRPIYIPPPWADFRARGARR
jgi:GcrA cell cycle regulator